MAQGAVMKKGLVTLVALLAIVLLASCGGPDSADETAGGSGGGERSGAGALPFAIVATAVDVPAWWAIRRRRRAAPAVPDAQSSA
jgi:hypothetical protein